jgi:hypothetical protein
MEDGNVENFLRELNSFGYKSNVFKSISLIATVKKGYNKPFPVRDQNLVATEKVKDMRSGSCHDQNDSLEKERRK